MITEETVSWVHIGDQCFSLHIHRYPNPPTGPFHRSDFPADKDYYLAQVKHIHGYMQTGAFPRPCETIIECLADGMRIACTRFELFDADLMRQYGG